VDLSRATLANARLAGIDLRGARLEEAVLDGADLANAVLVGANLSNARLERAALTGGVQAQGANFLNTSLQGADLTGAQAQFADFSSADMRGAILNFAQMQGSVLRDADLTAASLLQARLHGADLSGSKITGADLRGVGIWMTLAPQWDSTGMADLSDLVIRPLGENEQEALKGVVPRLPDADTRARSREITTALVETGGSWSGSSEHLRWQSWAGASPPPPAATYKYDLTSFLTRLMCSPRWSSGSIATGVARRAVARQFRGDVVAVYDGLKGDACPGAANLPPALMRDLSAVAEQARLP
jgi:hypothetical protein